MTFSVASRNEPDTAVARGKVCAVAVECLRDLPMSEEPALRFPDPTAYLQRQDGDSVGFYGTTDYRGTR